MNLSQFLLLRHEILLFLAAMVMLVAELSLKNKTRIIPFTVVLFSIITIAGFFPVPEGTLFGGSYRSTTMTVFMKNILNMAVLIIFLQSEGWLKKPENSDRISEFFIILLVSLTGMNFMISAGDFLTFYIGLETATIPLAGVAAFDRLKNRSAEAGIKFILSTALSSGVLLFGLSLIYGTSGTIYFTDIIEKITPSPLLILGFIFFIAGMGFKMALVPFHFWTPDVYEGSPLGVTSFLSVVSKGATVFILGILLFTVFRFITGQWHVLLTILAIMTMTLGNLFALRQDNLKRFLAFSSISQAGFILLGILGPAGLNMTTVIYYILIYVFMNLGAFGVLTAVYNASGVETLSGFRGLYHTNPKLSLLMLLSMFSLAGIPPVSGFFGKFFLFTAAAGSGYFILVLIAVLNATVALYYYLLVVKAMLIDKNDHPVPRFRSSGYMKLSLLLCLAGTLGIGFSSFIFEYIRTLPLP